jgi:hypothetical protein
VIRAVRGVRGYAVVTSVCAVTLIGAAGIAADVPGASAAQVVRAGLRYSCRFPAGSYPTDVEITATSSARAAKQIQPIGVQISAVLPSAVRASLVRSGSKTLRVSDVLDVVETGGAKSRTVKWPTKISRAYPITGAGRLPVAASGMTPAIPAPATGLVTFAAGNLTMALHPAATDKSFLVSCSLRGASRLAAVMVTASKPADRPASRLRLPKGCGHIKIIGTGTPTCGYITGYADVAKLIGAALLQPPAPAKPGLVNVDFAERDKFKPGELIADSTAELYYRGKHELPPVTATFLAFRFVPVTATLHITELTRISIVSVSGVSAPPFPITVTAATKISIHVTNVRVNGVPLNVGPNCRTAAPVKLVLVGHGENTLPPKGYTVPTGGPLSGNVTIPPFTGCGVTENLNPLFTGSISGRGNFVKQTQGKLCGPSQPAAWSCPPPPPKPLR